MKIFFNLIDAEDRAMIKKYGPETISEKVPCLRFIELNKRPAAGSDGPHYIYIQPLTG